MCAKRTVTTKLFVGNLPETVRRGDLLQAFEKFGAVAECDIVKNYAFIHYDNEEDAQAAVAALDDTEFQGTNIKVEVSHSRVRQRPGMGGKTSCYRCGHDGHWSKDCPRGGRGRGRGMGRSRGMDDQYRNGYRDSYEQPSYYGRDRGAAPDRYRPYPEPYERRPYQAAVPASRDPYFRERDPYGRPPPDYYNSRSDPYVSYPDYNRRSYPPHAGTGRASPSRQRVGNQYPY